ncbi:MAG TPA: hypothetical protein VLD18_11670, partial [Verrucomicrobiae bacterium]|nr:hypothetical protein [Verrucomicrobiae bacterium]
MEYNPTDVTLRVVAATGCTQTFDNDSGDGLWTTDVNWSGDVRPGPTDTACIPATETVTLNSSGTESIGSLINDGTLMIALSSTLDLAQASTSSGTLTLMTGTLTGTGDLMMTGPFNWMGGTLDGGGTTTAGGFTTISGGTSKSIRNRTLVLAGGGSWSGGGGIGHGQGAVISLPAGQLFDIQNDAGFAFVNGAVRGVFNNAGIVRKTAGTGVMSIDVTFNHTGGSLEINSGTMEFNWDFTSSAPISVGAGTLFHLNVGTHNLNAGTVLANAGTTRVSSPANFNAGASITTPLELAINGAATFATGNPVVLPSFNHTAGTLFGPDDVEVTGAYDWSGGIQTGGGTTTASGGLTLSGA